jgi:hypothetical protein
MQVAFRQKGIENKPFCEAACFFVLEEVFSFQGTVLKKSLYA